MKVFLFDAFKPSYLGGINKILHFDPMVSKGTVLSYLKDQPFISGIVDPIVAKFFSEELEIVIPVQEGPIEPGRSDIMIVGEILPNGRLGWCVVDFL